MTNKPTQAFLKLWGTNVIFKPFDVSVYQDLRTVLSNGLIDADTKLMVFDVGGQTLALVLKQMAYHHVAQGQLNGQAWAAFFCAGCNMGSTLTPIINGRIHRFSVTGIYNGMSIMSDDETGSSWEHVTGECVKGRLQGTQLTTRSAHYLTVAQTLEYAANAQIALSRPSWLSGLLDAVLLKRMATHKGYMPRVFRLSMARVDARLPELELGLGVWMGNAARFYPFKAIKTQGNALNDTLHMQPLVVYIDPVSGVPAAHRSASPIREWDGDALVLESGERIRSGYVINEGSQKRAIDTPNQQLTRWYGFSFMFPSCEIFSVNT